MIMGVSWLSQRVATFSGEESTFIEINRPVWEQSVNHVYFFAQHLRLSPLLFINSLVDIFSHRNLEVDIQVLPNLLIMSQSACFVAERVVHYSLNIAYHENGYFQCC